MYARIHYILYGMIITVAMVLTGCSRDDATEGYQTVTTDVARKDNIPIAFDFQRDTDSTYLSYTPAPARSSDKNEMVTTRATIGYEGAMDSEDLYYTGFGIFASHEPDARPDLMYNQEVSFTFVGDMDDPLKGFWSYFPQKYWPYDVASLYFCAYAPYVDVPGADDGLSTGIIGMSPNNSTTPYIRYRRCLQPEKNVDLLWNYSNPTTLPTPTGKEPGTMVMTMYHALSRLKINVKVKDGTLPADTKILLKRIVLSGSMTKTGKLLLNEDDYDALTNHHVPRWTETGVDDDRENRKILIDHTENNAGSYGIIDPAVRYIEDLPYAWQPAGVQEKLSNALTTTDRTTYVYLIPQESLTLNCKVTFVKMTASDIDTITKGPLSPITITPMKGNTTYDLQLTLKVD